ncbi:MAG TPA: hypothetical protein VGM90_20675 [Kofleriaceae bacterium]
MIGLHWAWNTSEMLLGIPTSVPVILGAIISAVLIWRARKSRPL